MRKIGCRRRAKRSEAIAGLKQKMVERLTPPPKHSDANLPPRQWMENFGNGPNSPEFESPVYYRCNMNGGF